MKAVISSVYPYLFLFFCFILPLDKYATAVPNLILIALIVLFPFVIKKRHLLKLKSIPFIILGSLILMVLFNSIIFNEFQEDIPIIRKVLSSFLIIVLFLPLENTKKILKAIIISVLFCIVASLINLYGFYISEGAFNFASGAHIDDVLVVDRLYLGFLCLMSIVASIGLIGKNYKDINKWYLANIVICILFVLLISSRIVIVILISLFFLKIFYSSNKKKYLFLFFGVLITFSSALFLNKNLSERFFYTQSSGSNKSYIELFKAWEPRVVIWECNYNIFHNENSIITGLGFYNTKDLLLECYDKQIEDPEKRNYFINSNFNPHNQFFDFFLSSGLIPGFLFVSLLFYLLCNYRHSFFKLSLGVSIFIFAFIECFFQRQLGASIFALIFILIVFQISPNDQSEVKIHEKN